MSIYAKRAAIVIAVLVASLLYWTFRSVGVTGSGGVGAVSASVSEALVETLVLAAVVCASGDLNATKPMT